MFRLMSRLAVLFVLAFPIFAFAQPKRAPKKPPLITRTAQNDARLAKLEAYIVNRINEERRARRLRPLTTDSMLAEVSRAHSLEMRELKYFAHESPTPELRTISDRYFLVFRDTPRLVAENIYRSWSSGPQRITQARAEEAHRALMESPGHRENILLPNSTRVGIGIIANSNGDLWVTQMFSRP